jgi:argininosuccinate lyase
MALLTTLKGLPLTYNRDLQEDKEGVFDSVDTLLACLEVCADMVATMAVDRKAMRAAADGGDLLATDYADYLVGKGMPFREAHGVLAWIAKETSASNTSIKDLSLDELKKYSELFDDDVLAINADSAIDARDVEGGTARKRAAAAIAAARSAVAIEIEQAVAAADEAVAKEIDAYIDRFRSMASRSRSDSD